MLYKEDWEKAKERLTAFWQGEVIDRCCVAVTAPRNRPVDSKIKFIEPKNLEDKWTNAKLILNNMIYQFSNTFYGGEAFPNLWIDLGPGVEAGFIGAKHYFGEDSIWYDGEHLIEDWVNMPEIKMNYESEMWKWLMEMTRYYSENANGNFHVSITDLGGTLDIVAYLRGAEQALYDMIDNPYEVKSLCQKIDDIWIKTFDKNNEIVNQFMNGCSDWMNIWCPGTVYSVQCDLATMSSPSQYCEFVLPSIERQVNHLDFSMYHLHMFDTPGLSEQLDIMLNIDRLTGIAFIPELQPLGMDHADERWFKYYKRIQEKGKRLMLFGVKPQSVEKLIKNLSVEGLHIHCNCDSEDEAREVLKKVEKWSLRP